MTDPTPASQTTNLEIDDSEVQAMGPLDVQVVDTLTVDGQPCDLCILSDSSRLIISSQMVRRLLGAPALVP